MSFARSPEYKDSGWGRCRRIGRCLLTGMLTGTAPKP